ncbi:MAG: trigger factor [Chthonomonadales bacterium]|nr:trigger factor [Chthonomonadales bacterium]
MQVTRQQVEPCVVELGIEVDAETVGRAFGRAYREFAAFTHVPGFRPGKAPRKMVERYVNPEKLRERVTEILAAPAYASAIQQEDLTPHGDPNVEFSELEEGMPWTFKAWVPTEPKVVLGAEQAIEVNRPVYAVTDEMVDREVNGILDQHARLAAVTDRPVRPGDTLVADLTVVLEGQEPGQPRRSLIRTGRNIPGFDEAITGQQIDEERTFQLTFPEDYPDAARAGRSATFTVRVVSINERVLPELTDEWAAANTPDPTAEQLRARIREGLDAQLKRLADDIVLNRIVQALDQRATVEYPSTMVGEQVEEDLGELGQELERRDMTYEQYLEATGLDEAQHREQLTERAQVSTRTRLLLRELARARGLSVSAEEVDEAMAGPAPDEETSLVGDRRLRAERRRRAEVANMLLQRKLQDLLLSMATITEVPERAP